MSLRLDENTVSDLLKETAEVIRTNPGHYLNTTEFPLKGSKGTSTNLSVTTEVSAGNVCFSLKNGGPHRLGRIKVPVEIFPGTAAGFLRDIYVQDPDELPPPPKIYSAARQNGLCKSARDGGMT